MQKKVFIIHYYPLEIYPPVQNLINFLTDSGKFSLTVCSILIKNDIIFKNNKVNLIRIANKSIQKSIFLRLWYFNIFNLKCLIMLILKKPDEIIYFDSHSSFSPFLYKSYFNKKVKISIHYHEYMTNDEYLQKGMRLVKYFHSKEHKLYKKAKWISHTNQQRMDFFLKDHPYINKDILRIMPNYPPKNWQESNINKSNQMPVRFVYVGSFASFETLYIKEFLEWIKLQNGKAVLEIYSFNVPQKISTFITNLNSDFIKLKGSVEYKTLRTILSQYDVGVILYKGISLNVIYSAPNKLFEYLACELDVWVPIEMTGVKQYITIDSYPKVLMVDYKNLETLDFNSAVSKKGLNYIPSKYYCENVYEQIAESIFK